MSRPRDYIDLSELSVDPAPGELAATIRRVIERVYDQEFTAAQIIALVERDPAAQSYRRDSIAPQVRREIRLQAARGDIEVVEQGGLIAGRRVTGRYRRKVTE